MKKGFTLSEVLITLGIVGVIAALTIPTILKNYRNKVYASQLKRVYSQISEAAQAIRNDEQTDNYYTTSAGVPQDTEADTCKTGPCYFLNNYFNLANRNCETGDYKCVGDSYKTLQGAEMNAPSGYCAQTVNGATICMSHNPNNQVTSICVDVNGPSEPNMAGRDVFSMDLKTDGSLSDYSSGSNVPGSLGAPAADCGIRGGSNKNAYEKSAGCMTKILEAGWKMDY